MFTYTRTAQYHETDQMGVIHHANYLKWMEEARIAFLDSVGLSYRGVEQGGIVSPVTAITVEYKRPVQFGDTVEIEVSVAGYTGVRCELQYTMRLLNTGEVCTTGVSKHCFLKNGRVIALQKAAPKIDAVLRTE